MDQDFIPIKKLLFVFRLGIKDRLYKLCTIFSGFIRAPFEIIFSLDEILVLIAYSLPLGVYFS